MKYRKLILVPMAALLFLLSACAGKAKPNPVDNVTYSATHAYWPLYKTEQKLVERGSFVLIGTVTDISYQVLDMKTDEPPTEKSEKLHCMLHTIYDIKVIKSYKGKAFDTVRACREGGDEGVRVEAQLKALGEDAVNGIPIVDGWPDIEVGKTYLFVLSQYEDRMPRILNPYQGILELTGPQKSEEFMDLPTLKDIITYFGPEAWNEFQKLLPSLR